MDVNYAELQHQIDTNPTVAQCRRLGSTHAAYGWCGHVATWWGEEHQRAYREAYDAERQKTKGEPK